MAAEHDLDLLAAFVAALVVFDRIVSLFPTRDAVAYPFVFQRFPEPVCVISAVPEQPIDVRQAAQQCLFSDIVVDPSKTPIRAFTAQ